MIAKLTGIFTPLNASSAIIEVGGVGYLVGCHARLQEKLTPGEQASLLIETLVNENDITLYGFESVVEQSVFNDLLTVKGVGPKLAMTILGHLTPYALQQAVLLSDIRKFKAITGVGPRLAERLILELKSRLAEYVFTEFDQSKVYQENVVALPAAAEDALAALVELGYTRQIARAKIEKLTADLASTELTPQKLIKLALRELA